MTQAQRVDPCTYLQERERGSLKISNGRESDEAGLRKPLIPDCLIMAWDSSIFGTVLHIAGGAAMRSATYQEVPAPSNQRRLRFDAVAPTPTALSERKRVLATPSLIVAWTNPPSIP